MLLNIESRIEINFFHLILDIRVHYLERKSFHVYIIDEKSALSLWTFSLIFSFSRFSICANLSFTLLTLV